MKHILLFRDQDLPLGVQKGTGPPRASLIPRSGLWDSEWKRCHICCWQSVTPVRLSAHTITFYIKRWNSPKHCSWSAKLLCKASARLPPSSPYSPYLFELNEVWHIPAWERVRRSLIFFSLLNLIHCVCFPSLSAIQINFFLLSTDWQVSTRVYLWSHSIHDEYPYPRVWKTTCSFH